MQVSVQQPTQVQMFYDAHRKISDVNETFLELVADGLTREELQTNIDRRPGLWGRFDNWLTKLPSSVAGATASTTGISVYA